MLVNSARSYFIIDLILISSFTNVCTSYLNVSLYSVKKNPQMYKIKTSIQTKIMFIVYL